MGAGELDGLATANLWLGSMTGFGLKIMSGAVNFSGASVTGMSGNRLRRGLVVLVSLERVLGVLLFSDKSRAEVTFWYRFSEFEITDG